MSRPSQPSKRKRTTSTTFIVLSLTLAAVATFLWDEFERPSAVTTSALFHYNSLEDDPITSIMTSLSSSSDSFLSTIDALYHQYGAEIATIRQDLRKWCHTTDSCKFCDTEAEVLYMLIRESKPTKVFEMAPNKGYSTHWILWALEHNGGEGILHSIDLHPRSTEHMHDIADIANRRWTFYLGDYQKLLLRDKTLVMENYDFIFIDALHTEEFSRQYCNDLLRPYQQRAIVAIHDIVADRTGGGRESAEVYKYLAFANNARHVFTMSRYNLPSLQFPIPNGVETINRIRASAGVVVPCEPSCDSPVHDAVYFPNGDSPTIFFQMN